MQTLKKFRQTFKGSSFPSEIETTSGETWVLKMRGSGNGVQGLISEFIVNRMAYLAGWEVPNVIPIQIPHGFPWEFGTDEFDEIVQKSFGINLGIQFIPDALPVPENGLKRLPIRFLQRMMALDIFFSNYDRLGVSQNVLKSGDQSLWLIDHAGCLFLDPVVTEKPFRLPPNHALQDEKALILSAKAFLEIANLDLASRAVSELPLDWLNEVQRPPSEIRQTLHHRITRLKQEIS